MQKHLQHLWYAGTAAPFGIVMLSVSWQGCRCQTVTSAAHPGITRVSPGHAPDVGLGNGCCPHLPRLIRKWFIKQHRFDAVGEANSNETHARTSRFVSQPASAAQGCGKLRLPPTDLEISWRRWHAGGAVELVGWQWCSTTGLS